MKELFKVGHFYRHNKGRCIAIVGGVETYKWGEMLVIEETDKSGHSISCVEKDAAGINDNWLEIGRAEWLRNFQNA